MGKRLQWENKTFGKYHAVSYHGYDYDKRAGFWDCINMLNGEKKILRTDNMVSLEKRWNAFVENVNKINDYKKRHNLND